MGYNLLLFGKRESSETSYDFTGGTLPAGCSFERASTVATRINSSGVLVSETTDVPRFDYDPVTLALKGLLYEPQSTNLQFGSVPLSTTWTNNNVYNQSNYTTAPDGNTTGMRSSASVTNTNAYIYPAAQISYPAGKVTTSIFILAETCTAMQLTQHYALSTVWYANFDTVNYSAGYKTAGVSSSKVTRSSGNWCRVEYTITVASTINSNPYVAWTGNVSTETGRRPNITVDGSTQYEWGIQIESGDYATSYIPTTTAAVTRSADQLTITVPAGKTTARIVRGDDTTKDIAVTAGAFLIPANTLYDGGDMRIKRIIFP